MLQHLEIHKTKRESYPCSVPECGKEYNYFSSLKKHMLKSHPDEYQNLFDGTEKEDGEPHDRDSQPAFKHDLKEQEETEKQEVDDIPNRKRKSIQEPLEPESPIVKNLSNVSGIALKQEAQELGNLRSTNPSEIPTPTPDLPQEEKKRQNQTLPERFLLPRPPIHTLQHKELTSDTVLMQPPLAPYPAFSGSGGAFPMRRQFAGMNTSVRAFKRPPMMTVPQNSHGHFVGANGEEVLSPFQFKALETFEKHTPTSGIHISAQQSLSPLPPPHFYDQSRVQFHREAIPSPLIPPSPGFLNFPFSP